MFDADPRETSQCGYCPANDNEALKHKCEKCVYLTPGREVTLSSTRVEDVFYSPVGEKSKVVKE
jgi:hypothetical protein